MATHLCIEDQIYIYGLLKTHNLVGQIWPVYRWDKDPPVYGLLLGREMAVQELRHISDIPITERQLRTVLEAYGIAYSDGTQAKLIADFYLKRRDRKIRSEPSETSSHVGVY